MPEDVHAGGGNGAPAYVPSGLSVERSAECGAATTISAAAALRAPCRPSRRRGCWPRCLSAAGNGPCIARSGDRSPCAARQAVPSTRRAAIGRPYQWSVTAQTDSRAPARLHDRVECLLAVAVDRMHLQIAAIVSRGRPINFALASAAFTSARLRKPDRSPRRRPISTALPLDAITASTVGDVPVVRISRMIRADEGPMLGIFLSVPSGCRQPSRSVRRDPESPPRRGDSPTDVAATPAPRQDRGAPPRSGDSCPLSDLGPSFRLSLGRAERAGQRHAHRPDRDVDHRVIR